MRGSSYRESTVIPRHMTSLPFTDLKGNIFGRTIYLPCIIVMGLVLNLGIRRGTELPPNPATEEEKPDEESRIDRKAFLLLCRDLIANDVCNIVLKHLLWKAFSILSPSRLL